MIDWTSIYQTRDHDKIKAAAVAVLRDKWNGDRKTLKTFPPEQQQEILDIVDAPPPAFLDRRPKNLNDIHGGIVPPDAIQGASDAPSGPSSPPLVPEPDLELEALLSTPGPDRDATLIANGYRVIPITGKRPLFDDWQNFEATPASLTAVMADYPNHTNRGLPTGALAVIDVDTVPPEHTMQFVALAERVLGPTSQQRFGSKGRALCYRNATPIQKINVSGVSADKKKVGVVEILGDGQQLAAFGIHPDTKREYDWITGNSPLNTPLADLPVVTPEQLRDFTDQAAALATSLGYPNIAITGAGYWRDGGVQKSAAPVVADAAFNESPTNIAAFESHLKLRVAAGDVPRAGHGGHDLTYQVAVFGVRNLGLHPAKVLELMRRDWYVHGTPNDDFEFLRGRVYSCVTSGQEPIGVDARAPASETFAGHNLPGKEEQQQVPPPVGVDPAQWARLLHKYRLRDPVEEDNRPPLKFWDAEHLWINSPEGAVGLVYGDTGTHKTGFNLSKAIDLVFNHPDKPRVAFYAGEGAYALGQSRVAAVCERHGKTVADLKATGRFHQISAALLLTNGVELAAAAYHLDKFKPHIIIVETFSRSTAGNYNAPDVVGDVYKVIEMWRERYHALFFISHHEGKDASRGATGSKMITNNPDTVIRLEKIDAITVDAYVEKMRDGPDDFHVGYRVLRYNGGVPVLEAMTEEEYQAAKRTAAKSKVQGKDTLRTLVIDVYRERQAYTWDTSIRERTELAAGICEKQYGPKPREGDEAIQTWDTHFAKIVEQLDNGAREHGTKLPRLQGLFDRRSVDGSSKRFIRWFLTPELAALLNTSEPGDLDTSGLMPQ